MEPYPDAARPGAMSRLLRWPIRAALVLVVAGCGGPGSGGSPSPTVTGAPTASAGTVGTIDHATGAGDVVLRYDETGGFVPMEWSASSAPIFTLYGDGTIVFRGSRQEPLPPIGSIRLMNPFRTARMSEPQMQSLLDFAFGAGGLGTARPTYSNDRVADATDAVFTINAGGAAKVVSVYALGIDMNGVADLDARRAFTRLRDHLIDIDQGGSIPTDVYAPDRYRAILLEGQPGAPDQRAWPWPEIPTAAFVVPANSNVSQLPTRVMTVAEVERLGIATYQGGFVGLPLAGPGDGKLYSLALRPLLPDESS